MPVSVSDDGLLVEQETSTLDFLSAFEVVLVRAGEVIINIKDGGISTAMIQDGAITLDKLALDSFDATKINAGEITDEHIAASAAIEFSKLAGVAADTHGHSPPIQEVNASSANGLTLRSASVECPANTQLVGCTCQSNATNAWIYAMKPTNTENGCSCFTNRNSGQGNHIATVGALCYNNPY